MAVVVHQPFGSVLPGAVLSSTNGASTSAMAMISTGRDSAGAPRTTYMGTDGRWKKGAVESPFMIANVIVTINHDTNASCENHHKTD